MSYTPVLTDEAIDEIDRLFNSKDYYIGVTGKTVFSVSNDVSELVFSSITS